MPSLLLVMFALQLALHIINTVGATTINEVLWAIWTKLPTPSGKSTKRALELKLDIVSVKRDMAAVSAQDDFARWAKITRQHDKAMQEFQMLDARLKAHKATFTTTISTLRWLGTQGLRFLLQMYYAKTPMFWLPAGWVPYYVEWILSFPRAPVGSVSINVWGIACASMLVLASEAAAAGYVLVTQKPVPLGDGERKNGEPMAFTARGEKKEL
ncbi:hypothetical protein K505DRAFT_324420 [Melanomma pulvis-pyrius CBS 109.77]|uniref:Uncharacterized protein n=1 Tax=Melanomma pulvis-pyrius CBS 109.77 TaxID=1314802 RepID=A0A6A6XG83_9PLEO|nr:hypothetical protein K505DRAFT_324420 [Melanomma pulvis-pyrius CBS 109.77]